MKNSKTIDYYNENADIFIKDTQNVDFTSVQDFFLSRLNSGAKILDFGCGSGRDTRYFIERGYEVDAIDGSIELCRAASRYTGIEVKNMTFDELDSIEEYDGIWACSSILHLREDELRDVLKKMADALRKGGIIYTSFKYGDYSGMRNGRFFTDMTEDSFAELIKDIEDIEIEEIMITHDVRHKRGEERWLNLILRK